jgi:hypothetical protein
VLSDRVEHSFDMSASSEARNTVAKVLAVVDVALVESGIGLISYLLIPMCLILLWNVSHNVVLFLDSSR